MQFNMLPENSNSAGNGGEEPQQESNDPTEFRVRNVQEINDGAESECKTEKRKRKLPSWLLSPRSNKAVRFKSPGEGGSTSVHHNNVEVEENVIEPNVDSGEAQNLEQGAQIMAQEPSEAVEAEENVIEPNVDSGEAQNLEQGAQIMAQEPSEAVEAEENVIEPNVDSGEEPQQEAQANAKEQKAAAQLGEGTEDDAAKNEDKKPDIKIKIEPAASSADDPCSSSTDTTVVKQEVIKQEATSSTRDSCKFGIRCYRRNLDHRTEMAHPGDSDYRRPSFPAPPKGTPECRYGDRCYRRNPIHFQHYSHPESTDFKKNWEKRQLRKRKQKKDPDFVYFNDDDDSETEGEEDAFSSDGSEDEYVPTDDE